MVQVEQMKKRNLSVFLVVCFALLSVILSSCGGKDVEVGAPTSIQYDGETISWQAGENATEYVLIINDGDPKTLVGTSYSYRIADTMNTVTFSVQSVNGDKKSDPVVKTLTRLSAVTSIVYADGKFDWDPVENATSYSLRVDGNVVSSSAQTEYEYLEAGTHTFSVRPLNDDSATYFSSWSANLEITILSAPKNVRFSFDTKQITWDRVTGASAYSVSINSTETTVTTNNYQYTGDEDGNISIKVKAIAPVDASSTKKYDSKYTEALSYTFLEKITEVHMEDGILTWNAVANATYYKLKLMTAGATTKVETVHENSYSGLQSGKTYSVEITAYGADDTYCPTTSKALTVNILAKPTLSFSHNTNANSTGANVISWSPNNGESTRVGGYTLKIEKDSRVIFEEEFGPEVLSYNEFDFADEGRYTISVKANANQNTVGDFDSLYSDVWTVTRLSTVSSAEVLDNNTLQPKVKFSSVTGATAYSVKLNGTEIHSNLTTTQFVMTFSNETSAAVTNHYTISAVANTNSVARTSSLPSVMTYSISVTKLATPTKPTISGTSISVNAIENAGRYEYALDNNATEISSNSFALPGLTAGDHAIKIRALSNSSNVVASDYSESLAIKKLDTPKNLKIVSGVASWGSVQNTTNFTIYMGTTKVNVDNQTQWTIDQTLLSISGTALYIYARGNGAEIVDSENSAALKLYKLQTPTGLMADNDNIKWNSVSSASSYKVLVNGNDYYQSTFSSTSVANNQIAVGSQTLSVQALGDGKEYFDSEVSNVLTVTKLSTPVVTRVGSEYTWSTVSGAAGYLITINNDSISLAAGEVSYNPSSYFKTPQNYTVKVRAIGNQQTTENVVISSDFMEISQVVKQIKKPNMVGAYNPETGDVTLTVTTIEENKSGYIFFASGINKDRQAENIYTERITEAGDYSYTAKIAGNVFASDGTYYVDSEHSSAYSFIVLQPVKNMTGSYDDRNSNNYTLKWEVVSTQTVEFLVTITVGGVVYENYDAYRQTATSVTISAAAGSTVEITVVALGNGISTFNSLPATLTKVTVK